MADKLIIFKREVPMNDGKFPGVDRSLLVLRQREGGFLYNILGRFIEGKTGYIYGVSRDKAKKVLQLGGGGKEIR